MSQLFRTLSLVLLLLAGCAAEPRPLPPGARPTLAQRWLAADGNYAWPPAEGFAALPVLVILPPGVLLDRFGGTGGKFFSPRGATYDARALPYVCEVKQYHVYQVAKPLPVWAGRAAAWFDQPGGATQFETDASVKMLLDDQILIEPVPQPAPVPCSN